MAAEDYLPNGDPFPDPFDHSAEDSFDNWGPTRRRTNITCKRCGQSGFHWINVKGDWRLADSEAQLHVCQPGTRPPLPSRRPSPESILSSTTIVSQVVPSPLKEPIMDKNAVAFIRNDVVSLGVQFPANGANPENLFDTKIYTYLTTDRSLSVGDWVIVQVGEVFKCARVVRFTNELEIEPNAACAIKYIVGRVDPSQYIATLEANSKIEEMLKTSYRSTLREGFRQTLLAGLDAEKQASISLILSSKE